MESDEVVELLHLLGVRPKPSQKRRDWIDAPCPMAGLRHKNGTDRNPSFGISVGKQSVAFCQGCGYSHHVRKLVEDLGMWSVLPNNLRAAIEDEHPSRKNISKPTTLAEQFERIVSIPKKENPAEVAGIRVSGELVAWAKQFVDLPLKVLPDKHPSYDDKPTSQFFNTIPDEVLGYLTGPKRKLTEDTVDKFQLGWDHNIRRILIPTFDCKDRLVGFAKRALDDEQEPKMIYHTGYKRNFYLFNENRASKLGGIGYVVEGQFDTQYLDQLGYETTVGVQGSSLSKIQLEKLILFFDEYVLFPDPDLAGIKLAQQIYDDLSKRGKQKKIRVAISEKWWKDVLVKDEDNGDVWIRKGRDPDEYSESEVDEIITSAVNDRPIDIAYQYGIIDLVEYEKQNQSYQTYQKRSKEH